MRGMVSRRSLQSSVARSHMPRTLAVYRLRGRAVRMRRMSVVKRWLPALTWLNVVFVVLALLQARSFIGLDLGRTGSGHIEAISLDYDIPFTPIAVLPYMSVYLLLVVTFVIVARGE